MHILIEINFTEEFMLTFSSNMFIIFCIKFFLSIICVIANRICYAPENKIAPCLPIYKNAPNNNTTQRKHSLVNKNSSCDSYSYEKYESRNILCDDGNTLEAFKCAGCGNVMRTCNACDNISNWYKNRKSANRHRRKFHRLESSTSSNAIENNEVDENHEEVLAMDTGFDVNDVERELHQMNYQFDLSNEDEKY